MRIQMSDKKTPQQVITDSKIVDQLISQKLEKIATRYTGWIALYKEKEGNLFWETFYPHGESQGGGPVALRTVDQNFIKENYGIEV